MNQLCKVCGEPAAGYHFGAFTCEGCKSFFGRTYNNLSALGECKNNGECVINKKNRTSCKSCRLKKCLMVGMSKSGSRYGRRSNWFKIHCLIQDQQEMAAKGLVDGGGGGSGSGNANGPCGKNGGNLLIDEQLAKLGDPKDFLQKYKENELRNSAAAAAAAAVASHHAALSGAGGGGGSGGDHHHHSRTSLSPRLMGTGSPTNSSDGSRGRGSSVSSPYSALFEGAKVPSFPAAYLPTSAAGATMGVAGSVPLAELQKEFTQLANRFPPAAALAGLSPLAPISPLSPLNAAVSRLFLQNQAQAMLEKRFHELHKLPSAAEQLLQASRLLPLHAAAAGLAGAAMLSPKAPSSHPVGMQATAKMELAEEGGLYADEPEQDGPIDLSVKTTGTRIGDFKDLLLEARGCLKHMAIPGDHDSGFSPSSNEDNHNTSPLDLSGGPSVSKRPCLGSIRRKGTCRAMAVANSDTSSALEDMSKDDDDLMMMMHDEARQDDDDESDDTSDVDVDDDHHDHHHRPTPPRADGARVQIECSP